MYKSISLLVLILFLAPVVEAKKEYEDGVYFTPKTKTNDAQLTIRGKIDAMTYVHVSDEISNLTGLNIVWLDSPGGDIESAIMIGELLRKHKVMARVPHNGECLSSCIFIYAGAVQRFGEGKIGIHRPYSTNVINMDMKKWQLWYEQVGKRARDYLKSVNVNSNLYDAMSLIPPEKIKILSDGELLKFGLVTRDPVYTEWLDNRSAQKYGLTRTEFMFMHEKAHKKCSKLHSPSKYGKNLELSNKMYGKCYKSVLNGN